MEEEKSEIPTEQAKALKEEKEKERAEKRAKKEQARAQKEALKHEREKERAEKRAKKEQVRAEREALKHERELKREQAEAEKEKKRLEKDSKRHQEQEQKRKMDALIQRQANIMKKLFKKDTPDPSSSQSEPSSSSVENNASVSSPCVSAMDKELAEGLTIDAAELLRRYVDVWKSRKPGGKMLRWGLRRNPKVEVFKELKLQAEDRMNIPSTSNENIHIQRRMKLLQFDGCFRPAYYGTHSKKSTIISPRHPLRKELLLDYEVDSDDEWEEEEPGASIAEYEESKELEEDEKEEKEDIDEEELEAQNQFVVPDGYFSEDEGIDHDCLMTTSVDKASEVLKTVRDRAFRTNRPYIITRDSGDMLDEHAAKIRESCLQALSVQILATDIFIEVPHEENEYDETPKVGAKRRRGGGTLTDSALPEIVQVLEETPQKMKKLVEILTSKFPGVSKAQMESKIREISVYVDNRWKVKDEILSLFQTQKKLSLTETENIPAMACKTMSNFSQKRCLPLEEREMDMDTLQA